MIALYREDGTLVGLVPKGEFRDGAVYVGNRRVADGLHCLWMEVPEQPVEHLRDPETGMFKGTLADLQQYTPEEKAALVDRDTGQAINQAIHPVAGIEEQIGILRDQLVRVLNALGIEPTPEFLAWNELAIQYIEAGQKRKVADA